MNRIVTGVALALAAVPAAANEAATMKRVSMELGGKSPNVVFADADLDAASKGAINAIFYGKGELCSAGSRLLVEESAHVRGDRKSTRLNSSH